MKAILRLVISIRTTVVLLIALSLLLLAGLVVPQRAVIGDEAVDAIATASPINGFFIDTLGLGAIATSPVFLVAMGLFYLNLVAVMIERTPRTLAKMRVNVPTPEAAEKWTQSSKALEGTAGAPLEGSIATILRGHGFRPFRVGPSSMYAVKHRTAAFGFLVFHVSFLFLCLGGVMIWYTRYVGETRAVEGQQVEAANARLIRMPRLGRIPEVAFTFDKITPTFDRGEATDLRATIRFPGQAAKDSRVNHPAKDAAASVLVNDIGIAPVLWLQNSRGFGIDRVAFPADRKEPVEIPMGGGAVRVTIAPKAYRPDFPEREALATLPIELTIAQRGKDVFRGTLRPGESASFESGRLVLQEVRYWAGLKIIHERGGVPLIIGFILATAGAIWRLLLHRRDLVISWRGPEFRLAGHGEWFADRDRRELMDICAAIERLTTAVAPDPHDLQSSKEAPA